MRWQKSAKKEGLNLPKQVDKSLVSPVEEKETLKSV
jgi:hypothetical protein